MSKLIIRFLIALLFLASLVCGVIATGSGWFFTKYGDTDLSNTAVTANCEEAVAQGEYKAVTSCWKDTMKASTIIGLALIAALTFGISALVLFAIGMVSIRLHFRNNCGFEQGTP